MTRVEDRNTADMAAQFTQIAMTGKRTPNNFCWHRAAASVFNILPTRQSEVILEIPRKTPKVLLKTEDLCLEMSSDFKYNFCFVVEDIFKLRNTTKS